MGARQETLQALRDGFTPGQISRRRGVSLQTTLQYLDQMVGEGKLRRSDILFSIPREVRQAIAQGRGASGQEIRPEDSAVVQQYGEAAHAMGDMYEDVRTIEMLLHSFIKLLLQVRLSRRESDWWRQGIPESIRKSCQARREEDAEPAQHAYGYTDLLDLGRIIEHSWSSFQDCMPETYRNNRKRLVEDLHRLNVIRRMVMHPVRGMIPDEDNFEFVRGFKARLLEIDVSQIPRLQELLGGQGQGKV